MGRKKNKHSKKASSVQHSQEETSHASTNTTQDCLPLVNDTHLENLNKTTSNPDVNKPSGNTGECYFEKYHPDSKSFTARECYVHSLCHMCKVDLAEKIPCPKCHMIMYCSNDHRREHWPVHAELCAVIVELCAERGLDHVMEGALNLPPDKYRLLRFQNMMDCENRVERPLDKWEREMFIFPNACGTCHETDVRDLTTCASCLHTSFCKSHKSTSHENWCQHLICYKNIVKNQKKFGIVRPSLPLSIVLSSRPKLIDMKHTFKDILNDIDEFEFLELTEIVTYPLTTLHVLLSIGKDIKTKLNLHVVGAEYNFEIDKLEKWEYYVLHMIPEVQHLEIDFVGPELNAPDMPSYNVCKKCVIAKKTIKFRFHNKLYHKLAEKMSFAKPDLVCAFNPGLYRVTGFQGEDSWSPTILSMFTSGCPVLTTAYTHREALLDVQRVRSAIEISLIKDTSLNPFSSQKPSLNFVSEEDSPVIFKNLFYSVMCKL